MSFFPYAVTVWLFVIGLYGVVTSRNLIHIAVCVSVCQSATYVLLLAIGYRGGGKAPIVADIPTTSRLVDPVVHVGDGGGLEQVGHGQPDAQGGADPPGQHHGLDRAAAQVEEVAAGAAPGDPQDLGEQLVGGFSEIEQYSGTRPGSIINGAEEDSMARGGNGGLRRGNLPDPWGNGPEAGSAADEDEIRALRGERQAQNFTGVV